MVLGGIPPGRVGRRRILSQRKPRAKYGSGLLSFHATKAGSVAPMTPPRPPDRRGNRGTGGKQTPARRNPTARAAEGAVKRGWGGVARRGARNLSDDRAPGTATTEWRDAVARARGEEAWEPEVWIEDPDPEPQPRPQPRQQRPA